MPSGLSAFALNVRYAFRLRKPRLTARLARAVLQTKLTGRAPLRYVDFAINQACNLRCEHCFAKALQSPDRPTMTVDDYARVARECMAMGTVNFSFQGGEPLLSPELPDIIRACRPERNVISVTTNGTLLSPEKVRQLRSWGVDILTVSLDSAIAAEHDAFRGLPGALEKTLAGIDRALAAGLRVTIGTVVTHDSLVSEGFRGLVDYASRKKTLLYCILPVPAGNWKANTDILMTREDLSRIEALTSKNPFVRTDLQANFGPRGCGAAKEILYLTTHGDVLPCPFMHIGFGNALREPMAVIRDRMLQNRYLKTYWPECLVATDRGFIDRHLSRTFDAPCLPMPAEDAFSQEDA